MRFRAILQVAAVGALLAAQTISLSGEAVAAAQSTVADISSPGTSAIVSGMVPIRGTAADPDFKQYELEFAPDPPLGDLWFAIQPPVAQQVRDGVLGAWDTTFVEDGRYLIRLRVVRNDGTEIADQVRVFVANATPTPTLTITPTQTATPTLDLAATVGGPTATPLIQQPPTRTPRPPGSGDDATPTPRSIDLTGGPSGSEWLGRAIWRGVQLALITFGLLGLYQVVRAGIRGGARRLWWQFRYDFLQPLIERIRGRQS